VSATDQRHRLLYPITEFVTWELRELRSELEQILAKPELPPGARPRKELQADLDAVIKEQDDRERIEREARSKARQADA
jgi:hypothetical protein